MKKLILITLSFVLVFGASAQIEHGGEPSSWDIKDLSAFDIPFHKTSGYDLAKLQAEDAVTDQYKETPYRFGIDHEVDIHFFAKASAEHMTDGSVIYRLGFHCPAATSISFLLDQCYIPEGGELFIWNEDRTEFKGSFTSANNKETGVFPIGLLHDDHVVMEYQRSAGSPLPTIHISQISHGYRSILNKWEDQRGPFGNSGACNVNVACPEGDDIQDQISSVALIVQGSSAICSGSMIANTSGDDTPYFLTADHCLGNPANWKYYFNHESSTCVGSSGPVTTSITGSSLVATNTGSDMALIELSSAPPEDWEIYYNGWNSSTSAGAATSAYGVHHPSGDVKKLCFENQNPTFSSSGGVAVWYIADWDVGVTEGGSSGSPLFNEDGHIIGQLFGGAAACQGTNDNGAFDVYGRFGVSFPFIDEFIDPAGLNPEIQDGYYPGATSIVEYDISEQITVFPNPTEGNLTVRVDDEGVYTLRVIDLSGKTIMDENMMMSGNVALNLERLESGVYILQLSNADFIGSTRFTVR